MESPNQEQSIPASHPQSQDKKQLENEEIISQDYLFGGETNSLMDSKIQEEN